MKSKFKAGARLIYQLGQELIPNEMVALLELVKNSYDADATLVDIMVDTKIDTPYGKGKIVVRDNGNGMTPGIVDSAFMKLSSSMKLENKISPYFERRVLGNKGIGRLAMQRLGRHVKLDTTPRLERLGKLNLISEYDKKNFVNNFKSLEFSLDWDIFLEHDNFFDIGVEISFYNETSKYGTCLEISGLSDILFWELDQVKKNNLKKQVLEMTNIYDDKGRSKFNIRFNIDNEVISNESISEDLLRDSADTYSMIKFDNRKLTIETFRHKKYLLDRVENSIFNAEKKGFEIDEEPNYEEIYKKFGYEKLSIDFDKMLDSYDKVSWLKKIKLEKLNSGEIAYPGDFTGCIYANERDGKSIKYIIENNILSNSSIRTASELKKVWEKSNGIYLFRDAFRILPYGENEWLGFTEYSQRIKNILYKSHTVSGYFILNGNTTENIQEQTNRNGIVENQFGRNLFIILRDVISFYLAKQDHDMREDLTPIPKGNKLATRSGLIRFRMNDNLLTQDNADQVLNDIKEQINNGIKESDADIITKGRLSVLNEKVDELTHINQVINTQYKQETYIKDTEISNIKDIYPLVSQGIIVQTLSHELNRIYSNIKHNANLIKQEITKSSPDTKVIKMRINTVLSNAEYIKTSISHLNPLSDKDIDLKEEIFLKNMFENIYKNGELLYERLNRNNIAIDIIGSNIKVVGNRGLIMTIFDNLILNSEYWLELAEMENKRIVIEVNEDGSVIFYDNGLGISKSIENRLFEPFVSDKPLKERRGLGLYISKELSEMMSGSIILLEDRNFNDRLYKFKIEFEVVK